MEQLLAQLNQIIGSQQSSLIAGVIAAFTPCILALIPLFLYRFGIWSNGGDRQWRQILRDLGLLLVGYFFSFTFSGLVLQQLTSSSFVNATRLTLGILLFMVGLMQLWGYISLQLVSKFSNPLVIGLILPFVVSFSPCVLPYFSTLVAGSTSPSSIGNFLLFGLGVILPAIVISIAGKYALNLFRHTGKWLSKVEKFSAVLVVFAGLYLSAQLVQVTQGDIVIAAIILLVIFVWQVKGWLEVPTRQTTRNLRNLLLTIVGWGIILAYLLSISPPAALGLSGSDFVYACAGGHASCEICNTVTVGLAGVAVLMAYTVVTGGRRGKRLRMTI